MTQKKADAIVKYVDNQNRKLTIKENKCTKKTI